MITENETIKRQHYGTCHPFKRICWAAIFVGALVGVGLSFLLNLFGIAIGLTTFTLSNDGAVVLAGGGLIGIIIGVIASMLAAGYAAGYLGRHYCPQRNLGILYGFTTWTVALLLSAIVATQVSAYVTSYANTISNSVFVVPNDQKGAAATITSDSTPALVDTNQNTTKVAVSPSDLAWGAFSVFALFFIGALASCGGACLGMSCKRDDCIVHTEHNTEL